MLAISMNENSFFKERSTFVINYFSLSKSQFFLPLELDAIQALQQQFLDEGL